jgi:uncharacterized OB-fold protein
MNPQADSLHLPDVEWEVTRPFWDGCRARELRMPRCVCGAYVWYPQPRCPACRSDQIAWTLVSGRATLFTWTTVFRSFVPGHAGRVPYVTALVELAEDPTLRLATFLVGLREVKLTLGLPLRVDFETISDRVVLPVFRPEGGSHPKGIVNS